ncbi:MAG TPA: hypothetical protein DCW83_00275 [Saprospirales bacterium]|jgi:hypothetical protein|nr:hypothetical protein [Saprospirales bacterium]
MTELEIEIELNRQMSDYYHEERMLRFRQNIKDAAFRGKMMDMKVMPVEKQESYHAYIARRYKELEDITNV